MLCHSPLCSLASPRIARLPDRGTTRLHCRARHYSRGADALVRAARGAGVRIAEVDMNRCIIILLLATFAAAQETPTEREAARDIVAQIAALQKAVDVAGFVQRLTVTN